MKKLAAIIILLASHVAFAGSIVQPQSGGAGGASGNKGVYLPPRGDEMWGVDCSNGKVTTFGTTDAGFAQSTFSAEGIYYTPSVWDYGCYGGGNASVTAPDGGTTRNVWTGGTNAMPTSNTCFTIRLIFDAPTQLAGSQTLNLLGLTSSVAGTILIKSIANDGSIDVDFNDGVGTTSMTPPSPVTFNGQRSGVNMLTIMETPTRQMFWLNGERVITGTQAPPAHLPVFSKTGFGWQFLGNHGASIQRFAEWDACTETTAQELADWAKLTGF